MVFIELIFFFIIIHDNSLEPILFKFLNTLVIQYGIYYYDCKSFHIVLKLHIHYQV